MTQGVCVSHPLRIPFTIQSCSSEESNFPARSLLEKDGVGWMSRKESENLSSSLLISFAEMSHLNLISMGINHDIEKSWPKHFRIEISDTGEQWSVIIREDNFSGDINTLHQWHLPLIQTKYIRLVIIDHYKKKGDYFSHIPSLSFGIHGIKTMKASSELDRLWTKENIIDRRPDYGWSSQLSKEKKPEYLEFDLAAINHINQISLKSKDAINPYFPKNFFFEYSKNGDTWYTIHEERDFIADKDTWYSWTFLPTNMRYFRIIIDEGDLNEDKNYLSQIIEIELYAVSLLFDHTHPHEGITPYATTLHAGLIRLAKDGESSKNVAVQGNDRRLKDATTNSKGIVRLAADGEISEFAAVQGNDKRLRDASETFKGIVQLAKDGEIRANVVVQANDRRIKEATTDNSGIVKLAAHGEIASKKVIQGDDPRLRLAEENFPGIVQLAKDGEEKAKLAVQGNDQRLKTATTERKGIVQLSKNGDNQEFHVVQANDKRLKDATVQSKGIVRLAKDGEDLSGVAVQGNDLRLKTAGVENAGIVRLAKHGEKMDNLAVQADDPRLTDAREAKPHTHDYAPKIHSLNDHKGNLWIRGEEYNQIQDTTVPLNEKSLVGAKLEIKKGPTNEKTQGLAILGIATGNDQIDSIAILGHGTTTGVRGQALAKKSTSTESSGQSAGVEGHGRDCPGGFFNSRHDFALVAGAKNLEDGSASSGRAILSQGLSEFHGSVQIYTDKKDTHLALAYPFYANQQEPISDGDLVSIDNNRDMTVIKSKGDYDKNIVGVAVSDSILGLNSKKEKNQIYVALHGIVNLKVDPSYGEIKPGDLLCASNNAGHAMLAQIDSWNKIGSIVGKALEGAQGKSQKIKVLLGARL